ncbi:LysR family transcriptional regulator [Stakelama sediminis]|uniref:DNA-binding transcriptional LysR family regulator n=1 Tax=Stakelama sediminis TaxID=463200 RepID=A0A840YUX9_9SPHN|nr:LysR family transcriptional regulator [Stakelama sediminis]MBB5717443.1 DNA-binding transcriptional LysR family regulator [Stakelama sediminis]
MHDFQDLSAFVAVARHGGFREAAKREQLSASGLSEAVRRLEVRLGVRLLNRTTRSVATTEAGQRLLERLRPALSEIDSALDVVNDFRDRPTGTLRLNVPGSAAKLILAPIIAPFLRTYPDIRVEITVEESFVDVLAEGCDAGIRYGEMLEQDMIATPIGPREQRFAVGGAPSYLDRKGRPDHPRDLLNHDCLEGQFASGRLAAWEFERDGETIRMDPSGPLRVTVRGGIDLLIGTAVRGAGLIMLFEDWLQPHFDSGELEPVLQPWWERFPGPFLYYPGRRYLPSPLRAFVDFVKTWPSDPGNLT